PIVAAAAGALALPGIGGRVAHRMTNKIARRHALAEHGVPQPAFAAVRTLREARVAAKRIGFPSVLKAADSAGQRGLFLLAGIDDLEVHLHSALSPSPGQGANAARLH